MLKATSVNEAIEAQVNPMREAIWMRMVKLEDVKSGNGAPTLLTNSTGMREAKARIRRNPKEAKCGLKIVTVTLLDQETRDHFSVC
jgi:hypothetical protein